MSQKTTAATSGFDINELVREIERFALNFIAATTPWLSPLIPAYMVYQNMISKLNFHPWIALAGAIAVEFLDLSAVHTTVEFLTWNDEKRKSDDKAPVWLAATTSGFYLVIVLTVNAVMEIGVINPVHVFVKAMLSLLSVVGAIILAVRAQHSRRLREVREDKEQARANRHRKDEVPPTEEIEPKSDQITLKRFREIMTGPEEGRIQGPEALMNMGVPKATAYRWWAETKTAG